jgi:hypothetical protein
VTAGAEAGSPKVITRLSPGNLGAVDFRSTCTPHQRSTYGIVTVSYTRHWSRQHPRRDVPLLYATKLASQFVTPYHGDVDRATRTNN